MKSHSFCKLFSALVGVAVLCALPHSAALAKEYPARTINVIVPYKAGGGTDAFARALTASSKQALEVPLAIINKPGASGITGARAAAQSRPDGYTIMLTSGGSFLLKSMLSDIPVGPFESFRFIAQLGALKAAVMVPINSPYKTVDELIAAAKAKPGVLRWAHSGPGSYPQVAGAGFLKKNNIEAQGIPFKGGGPIRGALMGNQVDFAFLGVQQSRGFEEKIKVLGLASKERDPVMSDIPTLKELGVPFSEVGSPVIVFAPKNTPDQVIDTLAEAIKTIAGSEKFTELLLKQGVAPAFLPPAEAEAALGQMKEEISAVVAENKG